MKKVKILLVEMKYPLLMAVFFFLPYERIPSFEVFGYTLKISYIFALLFLLLSFFTLDIKNIKFHKSDIFLSLFLIYSAVSIFWADDVKRAIIIWLVWLFVILIYKVISSCKLSSLHHKFLIDILLYSTVIVCVFGLYQFVADFINLPQNITGLRYQYTKEILGFPRIQSVALEPLYYSNFLLVPLYLSLNRYFNKKSFFNGYAVLVFLIILNIFLTVSRGAYLGLAFSLNLLIIYLAYKKERQKIVKTILPGVFAFIVAIILVFSFGKSIATKTFFRHIIAEDTNTEVSTVGRIDVYKDAIKTFKDNPLGIGISNWGTRHREYVDYTTIKGYGSVNNQYLEILVETGVFGSLFFLIFIALFVFEAVRKIRGSSNPLSVLLLFLGIVAILIQYVFFSAFYLIYFWVFLALLRIKRSEQNI